MSRFQTSAGASRIRSDRLRNEIVSGALVVTFSLLLLFAGFSYWQGRTILTETSLTSLEAVASVQEERLETYVETGVSDLQLVVGRNNLIRAMTERSVDPQPSQLEDIRRVLDASQDAAFAVQSISVFDPELSPVFATVAEDAGFDIPADYVARARQEIVSGLVVADDAGGFKHLVAGPILSEGELIGVAVVAQSTDQLFEIGMGRTGMGETGETIIAQTVTEQPVYIAPLRFDRDSILRPIPAHIDGLPMTEAVAAVETSTNKGTDYRGSHVFAVTRFIEGPGWGLVVKMDRSETLRSLDEYVLVALAAFAVGLVLAYFLAARTAEWIVRPVRRLTRTAKAIAGGRRDLRVGLARDDELGELALAFDDMTEQLNNLTTGLEERVEERTRELREKNAQLARVMQDKETFLAGVSHEVRSPLTAMIGFLDLVNDSGDALDPEEREEMLDTVSRQAEDVLNLIEDLLASARAEAGTLKVVAVSVNLAAQARQVVEAIAPNTRAHIAVHGDGVRALADPARIRQIIRNLLTNADRYGGSNVEVAVSAEGGSARVEVRDDGPGVPEEDRTRIFEAYEQSDSSRKVDGSVGLGLHVSQELARLMGGDLTYEYVDGLSVFTLSLPEHHDEDGAELESEAHPVGIAGA